MTIQRRRSLAIAVASGIAALGIGGVLATNGSASAAEEVVYNTYESADACDVMGKSLNGDLESGAPYSEMYGWKYRCDGATLIFYKE